MTADATRHEDTRDRLVRAVLDQPAEDTPRLELADRLDELGRPADVARAELIRAQCESARGVRCPADSLGAAGACSCPTCALRRRADALLRRWGLRWLPRPGRMLAGRFRAGSDVSGGVVTVGDGDKGTVRFDFTRGFVSAARVLYDGPVPGLSVPGVVTFEPCGRFVRRVLAACPCERVTFAVAGHEPEVTVDVARDAAEWSGWGYVFRADDLLLAATFPTRRALVSGVARLVAEHLSRVTFFTTREYDAVMEAANEMDPDDEPEREYDSNIDWGHRPEY